MKITPIKTKKIIKGDDLYKILEQYLPAKLEERTIVAVSSKIVGITEGRIVKNEIFVIGGANIYEQTIGRANKLYLTVVEGNPQADAYFPDYSDFKNVVYEKEGEFGNLGYKFLDLER